MICSNNVLNIRSSQAFTWLGQTGEKKGFCVFESVEMCRRAGLYLLMRSYRRAGCDTIEKIVKRFAPAMENPTESYINYVCARSGLSRSCKLVFDSDYASVLAAMEIFEQGIVGSQRDSYFETARASYQYLITRYSIKRYEKEN